MTSVERPMFPLGSVLVPSMVLPLHLFEDRYRTMIRDVLESEDRSFGVVLIERGHEVGGQDVRSDVGTLARVVEAEQTPDGRWGVVAVGIRRLRVERWLPDDPYPRAVTTLWDDDAVATPEHERQYGELVALHRRLLALVSELGYDVGAVQDLTDDPVLGTFQLTATAPISTYDRHRLLATPTVGERLELLAGTLGTAMELAELELGQVADEGGTTSP